MKSGKAKAPADPAEVVAGILQHYASRGVFRGFSRGPGSSRKATFKMLWHRNRSFEVVLDLKKSTLTMPLVLPAVPPEMYKAFQEYIRSRHSEELPEHRRIDPAKATLKPAKAAGNVSLTVTIAGGDYEYATRKLIHTVHEIFLSFLPEGYFEYMVEQFDLDPDKP